MPLAISNTMPAIMRAGLVPKTQGMVGILHTPVMEVGKKDQQDSDNGC